QNITMDGNKNVTATFTQITYTLNVTVVGSGSVAKNPDMANYPSGSVVQLTATANAGWVFSGWSGDLSGSNNPENITMDSNKNVTATFTQVTYTLNVTVVGSGTVTKNPDQATYNSGDI